MKHVISLTERLNVEKKFNKTKELNEIKIPNFASNLLDGAAGLVIAGFGTKIVGAVQTFLGNFIGKKFRLPVKQFYDQMKYNLENDVSIGAGDATKLTDLQKVYDEFERLIQNQMSNVKSRSSLFSYLSRSPLKKPVLKKTQLKQNRDVDIFNILNTGDPKKLENVLKKNLDTNNEKIIKTTLRTIIRELHPPKSVKPQNYSQREKVAGFVLLKKYNIETYKYLKIGDKEYTDLRSYIIALMELSTTNKKELEELDKKIKDKFGDVDYSFIKKDTSRVSTANKSNFSWLESKLISDYLIPRLEKILKLRDNAIESVKKGGINVFKTRQEKLNSPKQKENFIKKNIKSDKRSYFYYKGEVVNSDVLGTLMAVSPVEGSASKFIKSLKNGYVEIDFIFDDLEIEGTSLGRSKESAESYVENETRIGAEVSAKILIRDLLVFFQILFGNARINLLKIIRSANKYKDYYTFGNSKGKGGEEETTTVKRGPGRPKKGQTDGYVPGGFNSSSLF